MIEQRSDGVANSVSLFRGEIDALAGSDQHIAVGGICPRRMVVLFIHWAGAFFASIAYSWRSVAAKARRCLELIARLNATLSALRPVFTQYGTVECTSRLELSMALDLPADPGRVFPENPPHLC